MSILIEISYGELIDKITILEIKEARINDPLKLRNIRNELMLLESTLASQIQWDAKVEELTNRLRAINSRLWDVEDRLREKERDKIFDEEFVELARGVYFTNDERARVKRELNEILHSGMIEEKSYQSY